MPNLKQLLIARNEWIDSEIMRAVHHSDSFAYLTPAQSRLLAHMGGRPTSMAALSRKLAISRQAVHKTVGELARRGILSVSDDPERRNAKRIQYTELGKTLNRSGAQIIAEIEKRVSRQLGDERYRQLIEALSADWSEPSSG
ncbi:MAG: helix-turn-helix domain-containing protein [Burkholderiaceae bacterium]